ncbi:MAG: hypothetical protein Q8Q26_16875, partial [Pseudorhodobacter sp.]|nr:hypothetical protein [Pseudorhodobacter sp.]
MVPYEELPDDDFAAFMQLESEFRKEFEANAQEPNSNYEYESADYMNKTLAAANPLGIEALANYDVDTSSRDRKFSDDFTAFKRDVDNIIIQMRILNSRRRLIPLSPGSQDMVFETCGGPNVPLMFRHARPLVIRSSHVAPGVRGA